MQKSTALAQTLQCSLSSFKLFARKCIFPPQSLIDINKNNNNNYKDFCVFLELVVRKNCPRKVLATVKAAETLRVIVQLE